MRSSRLSRAPLALMALLRVGGVAAEERGFLRSSRSLQESMSEPSEPAVVATSPPTSSPTYPATTPSRTSPPTTPSPTFPPTVRPTPPPASSAPAEAADSSKPEVTTAVAVAGATPVVTSTKSLGTRTFYFVLISVEGSRGHAFTLEQWIQTHFRTQGTSFKTQLEGCSMGKLRVVSNGGIAVTVPGKLSDYTDFTRWVTEAVKVATARLGRDVNSMADHLAFCSPPDTTPGYTAVGLQNGNRINVQGRYCMSMSLLLHEFGHNFNLLHSGIRADPYADTTGYMGASAIESNGPRKCFNGYKSYQLRWYADRHLILRSFSAPRKIQLAAFVDYRKTRAYVQPVVINLFDKFFLQYNRAKGINSGTLLMRDRVTIVSNNPSQTDLLVGLGPGMVWTTMIGGRRLYVAVCRRVNAPVASKTAPDVMVLTIGFRQNWCGRI